MINEVGIDGKEYLWSDQRTRFVVEGVEGGEGLIKVYTGCRQTSRFNK